MPFWALSLLLLASTAAADCPPGSTYDDYFNRCYQFFPTPQSFLTAEQKCISIGGHLADIQNAFENFYIAGEAGHNDFWIGANLLISSNWTWSSNTPMTFTNWGNGQRVNSNLCAYARDSDHKWGTLPCNTQLPFICAISPNATQTGTCPTPPPPPTLSSSNSTCAADTCPTLSYCTDGYSLYTRNCLCYKYFNDTFLSFVEANTSCAKDGGMLAKIPSQDVNDFLTVLPGFNVYNYGATTPWIGLTCASDSPSSTNCTWADGSPLGNYSNFDYKMSGHYTLISVVSPRQENDGKWECVPDYYGYSRLCQKDSIQGQIYKSSARFEDNFAENQKTLRKLNHIVNRNQVLSARLRRA